MRLHAEYRTRVRSLQETIRPGLCCFCSALGNATPKRGIPVMLTVSCLPPITVSVHDADEMQGVLLTELFCSFRIVCEAKFEVSESLVASLRRCQDSLRVHVAFGGPMIFQHISSHFVCQASHDQKSWSNSFPPNAQESRQRRYSLKLRYVHGIKLPFGPRSLTYGIPIPFAFSQSGSVHRTNSWYLALFPNLSLKTSTILPSPTSA